MNRLRYSQNFITCSKHVERILAVTGLDEDDHLIEIGSGKGHFTRALALLCSSVIAIELDPRLVDITRKATLPFPNVEVVHTDVLEYDFSESGGYTIFGSIPYFISTAIVRRIAFESEVRVSYLIVEAGFAKRLQDRGRALGLLLDRYFRIDTLMDIPRNYFSPQPKVESVLLRMLRVHPLPSKEEQAEYEEFVFGWVAREYRRLFTKNQVRRLKKHYQVEDLIDIPHELLGEVFESYRLFRN